MATPGIVKTNQDITPGDVSLLARELHAILQAAEILEGSSQSMPLYWAAERLSKVLKDMTKALECRVMSLERLVKAGSP